MFFLVENSEPGFLDPGTLCHYYYVLKSLIFHKFLSGAEENIIEGGSYYFFLSQTQPRPPKNMYSQIYIIYIPKLIYFYIFFFTVISFFISHQNIFLKRNLD